AAAAGRAAAGRAPGSGPRPPHRRAGGGGEGGGALRRRGAPAVAAVRPGREREGRGTGRGLPRRAAGGERARGPPLPAGAAPGGAGAPRGGRAPGGDRRRLGRSRPPPGIGAVVKPRTLRAAGDLPTGAEKVAAVDAMFDAIAPGYDVTNRVISLGLDVGWRRRTVRSLGLPPGSVVLDLACGTGDLCRELARQGLTPLGADRSAGMLDAARASRGGSRRRCRGD